MRITVYLKPCRLVIAVFTSEVPIMGISRDIQAGKAVTAVF